jgi:putative transposase
MHRVVNYPVQLTVAEESKFNQVAWGCRMLWNDLLSYWNLRYQMSLATGIKCKPLSEFDLTKVIQDWRNSNDPEMAYLKDVPVYTLRDIASNLHKSWSAFFKECRERKRTKTKSKIHSRPPKRKKFKDPITSFVFNACHLEDEEIWLGRFIWGTARIWTLKQSDETIQEARLLKTTTGRFEFHVHLLRDVVVPPKTGKVHIGIDSKLGEHYAALSSGQLVGLQPQQQKRVNRTTKRIKHLQRKQAKAKIIAKKKRQPGTYPKTSNHSRKRQLKINKGYERNTRTTEYSFKQFGHAVAHNCDHATMEGYNPHHLCGGNLGGSFQRQAIGKCRTTVQVSCAKVGTHVTIADKMFPSTKLCSECNYKYQHMPLSVREWTCPQCGTLHDRDQCAGENLTRYTMALTELELDAKALKDLQAKNKVVPDAGTASVKDEPPGGRAVTTAAVVGKLLPWEQCKTRITIGTLPRTRGLHIVRLPAASGIRAEPLMAKNGSHMPVKPTNLGTPAVGDVPKSDSIAEDIGLPR